METSSVGSGNTVMCGFPVLCGSDTGSVTSSTPSHAHTRTLAADVPAPGSSPRRGYPTRSFGPGRTRTTAAAHIDPAGLAVVVVDVDTPTLTFMFMPSIL